MAIGLDLRIPESLRSFAADSDISIPDTISLPGALTVRLADPAPATGPAAPPASLGLDAMAVVMRDFDALYAERQAFLAEGPLTRLFDGAGLPALGAALERPLEVTDLATLVRLAEQLPGGFGDPDATGEVPTGSAAIGREEAAVAATLAAAPRILDALGPDAVQVLARGQSFAVVERYEDPLSGFLAVRLAPAEGGPEVFAVDGLQVGSRADEATAATLGRLQAESAAFRAMIADAAAAGAEDGGVRFTGPSLGGAVAQVAAYETAEALLADGVPGPEVRLVTVDPLGGRDAAEAINGALDPAVLAGITALNLRTEGDAVSRIGSHIGATLTLPGRDAAGNVVALEAREAHVDVVSLLQNLSRDDFFAAGRLGAPAEISGFARASEAGSDELIALWRQFGEAETTLAELQVPGVASFDATRTLWSLDLDTDGTADIAVRLAAPAATDVLLA
ncbi:hypothetical protein [Falsiroseomonas oryziterrae]|uniref:hypothetical protein n=1 Tax=Falsiroseomonas oryziterrae TaxID=2911368 RepID=UPI001F2EBE69|nr:hypothetical protein [Roseomonas sp. NPKOSM-4]